MLLCYNHAIWVSKELQHRNTTLQIQIYYNGTVTYNIFQRLLHCLYFIRRVRFYTIKNKNILPIDFVILL